MAQDQSTSTKSGLAKTLSHQASPRRVTHDRVTSQRGTVERVKIEITSQGFGAVDAASILNHPNVKTDLQRLRSSKLAKQIKRRKQA